MMNNFTKSKYDIFYLPNCVIKGRVIADPTNAGNSITTEIDLGLTWFLYINCVNFLLNYVQYKLD